MLSKPTTTLTNWFQVVLSVTGLFYITENVHEEEKEGNEGV